jgi:hypothetical protein
MNQRLCELLMVSLPYVGTCFVMYLLGAFVSVSWNPVNWTSDARIVCAFWGMVFGFAVSLKLEAKHDHL